MAFKIKTLDANLQIATQHPPQLSWKLPRLDLEEGRGGVALWPVLACRVSPTTIVCQEQGSTKWKFQGLLFWLEALPGNSRSAYYARANCKLCPIKYKSFTDHRSGLLLGPGNKPSVSGCNLRAHQEKARKTANGQGLVCALMVRSQFWPRPGSGIMLSCAKPPIPLVLVRTKALSPTG